MYLHVSREYLCTWLHDAACRCRLSPESSTSHLRYRCGSARAGRARSSCASGWMADERQAGQSIQVPSSSQWDFSQSQSAEWMRHPLAVGCAASKPASDRQGFRPPFPPIARPSRALHFTSAGRLPLSKSRPRREPTWIRGAAYHRRLLLRKRPIPCSLAAT